MPKSGWRNRAPSLKSIFCKAALRPLDQEIAHLIASELLQIAVAKAQVPARVDRLGQRLPVPLRLLFFRRQVLFEGFQHLAFRHPLGLIAGLKLGGGEVHAAEVAGVELDRQQLARPFGERLGAVVLVEELVEIMLDLLVDHLEDQLLAVGAVEDVLAVAVDAFSLLVHHFVVFEQVFADLEVAFLDLLLRAFDAARDHAAFDRLALLHAEPGEHVFHPFAGEDPHQVVFQREVEAAAAGVALPAATAAKLEVDSPGFVAFGADDVQPAHAGHDAALGLHLLALLDLADQRVPFLLRHFEPGGILLLKLRPGHGLGIAAEDDVGSAAGHVRGDGHRAQAARLGDDFGLALVMLGVEHLVLDAPLFQQARDQFASLDRDGADQNRPPAAVHLLDLALGDRLAVLAAARLELDVLVGLVNDLAEVLLPLVVHQNVPLVHPLDFVGDGNVLFMLGAVDHVGIIDAMKRLVRRNGDHVELVDFPELGGLGHGGAGHAADFVVELEEVLQRDGGQRLVLFLDADALLGFDGLVQAVAPVAARHQAAGEFIDDDHLLAVDDVVDVAFVEVMGLQGVVDQVGPLHVAGRVETLDARQLLGRPNALVGQVRRVFLLVDLEMRALFQLPGDLVGLGIAGHVVVRGTGDNQRRPRLVDQNVVHFVDDGEMQRPLRLLIPLLVAVVAPGGRTHVVAEIIEAELVVRAVGDVAGVGFLAILRLHVALDRADGQSQRHIERAHPFHVAAGEVVVDRHDVDALLPPGRSGRPAKWPPASFLRR